MTSRYVTTFLALLVAFTAPIAEGQPTPTPPNPPSSPNPDAADLNVTNVRIIGPDPAWIHGSSRDTTIEITIGNQGKIDSAGYRINYQWAAGEEPTWLNGNEASSFDASGSPLGDGDTRSHTAPWRLQPEQTGLGKLRVTVVPAGPDATPLNDLADADVFVPIRDVSMRVEDHDVDIRPQETTFIRLWIDNRGNRPEAVELAILNTTLGAATRLEEDLGVSRVTVAPGGTNRTEALVRFPFTGDSTPFTVLYQVEARTSYGRVLRNDTGAFASNFSALPPPSTHRLAKDIPGSIPARPGHDAAAALRIQNLGPLNETYDVTARTDVGWNVDLSNARFALTPGEGADLNVTIKVPANALLGSTANLVVEVQGRRAAQTSSATFGLVNGGPFVVLSPGSSFPSALYVDDICEFPVRITNLGDEPTPTFAVATLRITPRNGEVVTLENLVPPIPPGGDGSTMFHWFHSLHCPDVDSINVEAGWETFESASVVDRFSRDIAIHSPNVIITPPPGVRGAPGETVQYRSSSHMFRVRNTGNADETFHLAASTDAGRTRLLLDSPNITLRPTEERLIPLEHALPLPAGALLVANATLKVQIAGRSAPEWSANVTSRIVDANPPKIELAEPLPAVWAINEVLPLVVLATDDTIIATVFANDLAPSGVTTLANLTEEPSTGRWSGVLPFDERGNHSVSITAIDGAGRSVTLAAGTVDTQPILSPLVAFLKPDDSSVVDTDTPIIIKIQDQLPISRTSLRIVRSGTLARLEVLPVPVDGLITFNLKDAPDGNLTLVVEAQNAAGARGNATRNLILPRTQTAVVEDLPDATPLAETKDTPSGAAWIVLAVLAVGAARRRTTQRTRNGQKRRNSTKSLLPDAPAPPAALKPPVPRDVAPDPRPLMNPVSNARPLPIKPTGRRRFTRRRVAATLFLTGLLLIPSLIAAFNPAFFDHIGTLEAPETTEEPSTQATASRRLQQAAALRTMFSGLPASLSPDVVLGPASSILFEDPRGLQPRVSPANAGQLFDIAAGGSLERVPIPEVPPGPEPLLAALTAFAAARGEDLPEMSVLRPAIAALRLQPESEGALAQMVLAYRDALVLEERSLRDLSLDERALAQHDVDAVAAWFEKVPSRDAAELEAMVADLTQRADPVDRVRAADLLVRTMEHTKDRLALPPLPVSELPNGPPPRADLETQPEAADTDPVTTQTANLLTDWIQRDEIDWAGLEDLLFSINPVEATPLDVPQEGLRTALTNLAITLGYPEATVPLPPIDLPPSLANAVAMIVSARRVGLESDDAAIHAATLFQAIERAEPVLRAWAAVLEFDAASASGENAVTGPDPSALALATLLSPPSPGDIANAALGATHVSPSPATGTLADWLVANGASTEAASLATAGMSPNTAAGLATALDALDRLDHARHTTLDALTQDQRYALERSPEVAWLLERPKWSTEQANLVEDWALGMGSMQSSNSAPDLGDDLGAALQALEDAVGLLSVPPIPAPEPIVPGGPDVPLPVPGSLPAANPALPATPPCPDASPLSKCQENDVWLYTADGGGLLVTGFQTSSIDSRYGNPRLIVDLGGNDVYLGPAGAARGAQPTSVVIDVGGNDLYSSELEQAHGAAEGLGAFGVLWDVDGDDKYQHIGDVTLPRNAAQGYGGFQGLGVLFDGGGRDVYDAANATAHGVGLLGGVGLFIDAGAGGDELKADRGQGYASGPQATGVLLNEQGANNYTTLRINPRFQGGHKAGDPGAVGLFVDLGGEGTGYSNLDLPQDGTFVAFNTTIQERKDDALWLERSVPFGVGLGIDSTLADDDGDNFVNLVELFSGSDPQDGTSVPGVATVGVIASLLEGVIGEPPSAEDPTAFLEGVSFADHLFCADVECSAPISLLSLSGTNDGTQVEAAHIMIDLGGNDTYETEVAGPGHLFFQGARIQGVGSILLELGGNDHYATPTMTFTQASIDVSPAVLPTQGVPGPTSSPSDSFSGKTDVIFPVSLLIETGGNDIYEAGANSQASAVLNLEAACNSSRGGIAWLIDSVGNDQYHSTSQARTFNAGGSATFLEGGGADVYEFSEQAASRVVPGEGCGRRAAVFVDAAGRDTYNSTTVAVNVIGLSEANPDQAFESQGISSQGQGQGSQGPAIFVDFGSDFDTFMTLNQTSGFSDISFLKNNIVRNGDPLAKPSVFADNPTFEVGTDDADGDGASNLLETVAGSDPEDPESYPGSFQQAPGGIEELLGNPNGITPEGVFEAVGLNEPGAWLRVAGLTIGGRTDDVYVKPMGDFFLDLAGNDTYAFANVGGRKGFGVTVMFDVGDGNDEFAPELCHRTTFTPPPVNTDDPVHANLLQEETLCPSLGGAIDGLAVLGDAGGSNHFLTEGLFEVSESTTSVVSRVFQLVSQGAAISRAANFESQPPAVGVLVTWNATNEFEASLEVRRSGSVGTGSASAVQAVAQGASRNVGVGLLASFGRGDDTYTSNVKATVTGRGYATPVVRSISQGAVDGGPKLAFTSSPTSHSGATGAGILFDEGGDNRFLAPDGYSQGFSAGNGVTTPIGLLWVGGGNDQYDAGAFSQGAGRSAPGGAVAVGTAASVVLRAGDAGILFDMGGNDDYKLTVPTGTQAYGQGASLQATGVLLDISGDDEYMAPDATRVQGASSGGSGLLFDLGGHDHYVAMGDAQGFGNGPGIMSLLLDANGRDIYDVGTGKGQGFTEACAAVALFIDGAGLDKYIHGGTRDPATSADQRTIGENDWTWQHKVPQDCPAGIGSDASHINMALTNVRGALPDDTQEISLSLLSGSQALPSGAFAAGDVIARATLRIKPLDPEVVRRVTFLTEGGVIGEGQYVGPDGTTGLLYDFVWHTGTGFVDGPYQVWATAFIGTGNESVPANGGADLPHIESAPQSIRLDNPPVISGEISGLKLSPALGVPLSISVSISPDAAFPPGVAPSASCESNVPGGYLAIIGVDAAGTQRTAFDGYCGAGLYDFDLPGRDAKGLWPDGMYAIRLALQDGRGNVATKSFPVLIDSAAPETLIATPRYAGIANRGPGSSFRLTWQASDGTGAGLNEICISRVDAAGIRVDDVQLAECFGASTTALTYTGVETGDELKFVGTASDVLGNLESPCKAGFELTPCYLAKASAEGGMSAIFIDFAVPLLADITLNGEDAATAVANPNELVRYEAEASDVGAGVDSVTLRLPGLAPIQMASAGDGSFFVDADLPSDEPREESYTFRVVVRDRAGNLATEDIAGVLDNLAPRVIAQTTVYSSAADGARQFPAGRPGLSATIRAEVTDAAVDEVMVATGDVSQEASVVCTALLAPLGVFECIVPLRSDLADGDYAIPIIATDQAGNTNSDVDALVQVRGQPVDFDDLILSDVRADGFTVDWESSAPAAVTIRVGRSAMDLTAAEVNVDEFVTQHALDVAGLSPSTPYFFQVIAESRSGITTQSATLPVTTLNGFDFELVEGPLPGASSLPLPEALDDIPVLRGDIRFVYEIDNRLPGGPVSANIKLQDVGRLVSPVALGTEILTVGSGEILVNTTTFADGQYRLVIDLDRTGDRQRVQSDAFRIDNTAPTIAPVAPLPLSIVAEDDPIFELVLVDPLGTEPPAADLLAIKASGADLDFEIVTLFPNSLSSVQRRVSFRLVQDLPDGPQQLNISIADRAGNVGLLQLAFTVDTTAPRLTSSDLDVFPGPAAAKPGGQVRLSTLLEDASRVASVRIDLAPIRGTKSDLFLDEDGRWGVTFTVPKLSPGGVLRLPIEATDQAGNSGRAGLIELTVDVTNPTPKTTKILESNFTNARIEVVTAESAKAWIGSKQEVPEDWATTHELVATGLTPGIANRVVINLLDQAGNVAEATVTVTALADKQPPSTSVTNLIAKSVSEGHVTLTWGPAVDNAGIAEYKVRRTSGNLPFEDLSIPGKETLFTDVKAPAGRKVTYTIIPIDGGGLEGPLASVDVDVLALPHLRGASVSPANGPADKPFTFEIEYFHAAGVLPDALTVAAGDELIALHPVDRTPNCESWCLFRAESLLTSSSLFGAAKNVTFQAELGGKTATESLPRPPFVSRAGDGNWVDDLSFGGEAPASPAFLVIVVLLLVVVGIRVKVGRRPE